MSYDDISLAGSISEVSILALDLDILHDDHLSRLNLQNRDNICDLCVPDHRNMSELNVMEDDHMSQLEARDDNNISELYVHEDRNLSELNVMEDDLLFQLEYKYTDIQIHRYRKMTEYVNIIYL